MMLIGKGSSVNWQRGDAKVTRGSPAAGDGQAAAPPSPAQGGGKNGVKRGQKERKSTKEHEAFK